MPKGYHHLTYEQRCQFYAFLKRGDSLRSIARFFKIAPSTVCREVKRNSGKNGYRFKQAHRKASNRQRSARSKAQKFAPEVWYLVEYLLSEKQWSPEQISGWLSLHYNLKISHEWIYQYVWKNKKNGGILHQHLRRRGKKYNKRGSKLAGRGVIPHRVGIEHRPSIVNQRSRIGDYEIDTIVGAGKSGAILSIVDRKSKLTLLQLLPRATSRNTTKALIQSLKHLKSSVRTITADNGKEFAGHLEVAKELNAEFFFANPYCSWERAINENTNGLVRQYFPKKSSFARLTQQDIKDVQYLLNTRPRKTLNYKTPLEVFFAENGQNKLGVALRC